jgi:hypothetical protein
MTTNANIDNTEEGLSHLLHEFRKNIPKDEESDKSTRKRAVWQAGNQT